ncbi:hypothetical protein RCL_jg7650.t1 [Rhizophagus clarus]|uniref:Uncharacterized protein n=1 Tax=Rhizophagus clarus TaxID=94130 RepID=A0A8H3M6W7_9GLOM|nr:hypothetical protein RCL_jg7650.t1 [Rhizophagus clarus]
MDTEILKILKEATANSFKINIDFFQTTLPLLPQLYEGITVTTPAAAELFNKIPQFRLDSGLSKVKRKASQQQVVASTVVLTNKGKAKIPNAHADLPDLGMDVDYSHQSTLSTADTLPPPSDTTSTFWKPETATSFSSTASPSSTLDRHQPILSQPQQKLSAFPKHSDQSDDKIASLNIKKRKNESSTGDNNLIITGYQPKKNDKNLTLDLVIYDILVKWTNYQLLSKFNK